MYPGHRPPVSGRIAEQLESLKVEFDSLAHDVGMYKMQRDEYERKLQQQLTELSSIQSALFDLERRCAKAKEQPDGELRQAGHELESPSLPAGMAGMGGMARPLEAPAGAAFPPLDAAKRGFAPSLPLKRSRGPEDKGYAGRPQQSLPSLQGLADTATRPKEHDKEMAPRPEQPLSIAPKPPRGAAMSVQPGGRMSNVHSAPVDQEQPWSAIYNPNVQTNLKVGLEHHLEHDSVVCCVRFSADGQYLATGCNRKAQIFSVADGSLVHSLHDTSRSDDLYLRSVSFSPCGQYLACGTEDKTVKLWDIEREEITHVFEGHEMDIYSLDFSSDGRFIVSGSGDKKAKVWDVDKRKCVFTLGNDEVGPKDGVTSVAISPDGRLVAAGSLDHIVRLWDAHTGYFLERYEGHQDSVYSVAFSPDGKSLASGSLDKTLKLWDLSESRSRSRCRSTFTGHSDFVLSVAFSPEGNWLVSGSKDSSVQFWDPRNAVTHMKLEGHKNSVISVAVNPQAGTFATGSGDLQAKIWSYAP
mmetsp:Transcript_17672/g.68589  ORF Transcript_17672/g.68589 Transcript_17672/m.68589 type:complete len:526 (+) Transcript_17672:49-1626(+)